MEVDPQLFQDELTKFEETVTTGERSAAARYEKFSDYDPFEKIPPALLNAGHIASYAIACGMIEPFEAEKLVKPATYLVKVEGDCRYFDEAGKPGKPVAFYLSSDPAARKHHLDVRDRVRLAPNSLCFLTLAPEFRLPAYLGARFNLLIRDVYRGLLVGTGPLVDPGFTGRLSIPIHNFTDREYFITAGEGLLYFEFTKMSWSNPIPARECPSWLPAPIDIQPPFPKSKTSRKKLDDYLREATGGGPPASSIARTLHSMTEQAARTDRLLKFLSAGAAAAAVGLVLTSWSLYNGVQQFTAAAQTELRQERQRTAERLETLERRLRDAEQSTSAPAALPATPPEEELEPSSIP